MDLNFKQRFGFGTHAHDTVEGNEERKDGPRGVRSRGPVKYRHVTVGQMVRAEKRHRAAQIRKTNLRHRRAWHKNQQAIANLRGQIAIIDAGPGHPLYEGVADRLYEVHGSIDKARELHDAVLAKQAEARVQQALADLGKR